MTKSYLIKVPVTAVRKKGFSDTPNTRHREVMSIFGDIDNNTPRQDVSVLYRLEQSALNNQTLQYEEPYYLVLSRIKPTLQSPKIQVKEYVLPSVAAGQQVVFRVALNAIKRHDKGITPIPVDIFLPEEEGTSQLGAFLQRKLAPGLKDIEVINHVREVVKDRTHKAIDHKTIQVDTFDGVAVVDDPASLADMLLEGVGRAKAYGCGLLSVKPLM